MKLLVRYFIQGLLTAAPLFVTVYILATLFSTVGSVLNKLGIHIHPLVDPLIGFVGVLLVVVLIGMLASSLVFQSIMLVIDRTIERTSFIKTIYSSVKDLLSAFLGNKKKFNQPVLIWVNRETGNRQLGFITQTNLTELGIPDGFVSVYLPNSYAFSGIVLIVPKDDVVYLKAKSADVMKFIVSGGVTDFEEASKPSEQNAVS